MNNKKDKEKKNSNNKYKNKIKTNNKKKNNNKCPIIVILQYILQNQMEKQWLMIVLHLNLK